MANIKNIPLRKFRKWLDSQGCKKIRTNGGHEIWSRSDLLRSLALQTHIDPVPPRIIKQFLSYLEIDVDDFLSQIDNL
jgi:predicted RNA binding protein YcfA (HicA-like mRNA interferase family)